MSENQESLSPGQTAKGTRRKGRELALQALYEADVTHHSAQEAVERLLGQGGVAEATQNLARDLVAGVLARGSDIDNALQASAPQWPVGQVSAVDRNVLRLAIYEILFNNMERSVPVGVVINEAVDLAKRFGSENSQRFVNGVLGTISKNYLAASQQS